MANNGFIKLNRKMLEWEWYDDNNVKVLFLHLLFIANWKDKKWHGKTIKRGQVITSLTHLSEQTHLSIQQTRTALDKLISTNDITKSTTSTYTIITICNYNKYQDNNTVDNTQITNEQQTNNKRVTTTKEYKERKERKNIIYSSLQNAYNTHCKSLPKCTKITDQRKRMIDARLTDYSEEDFITVFKNAEESDFLSGRSGDWNSCNFDWLIKPNNFVKVLEGTYKNSKSKRQKGKIQNHTYNFDDLERKLSKANKK